MYAAFMRGLAFIRDFASLTCAECWCGEHFIVSVVFARTPCSFETKVAASCVLPKLNPNRVH